MSTLSASSCFTGRHSMSKKRAKRELGPFSITSNHQGLDDFAIPMWLGTRSNTWPIERDRSASIQAQYSSAVPISALMRVGSITSYPCGLPGTAVKYDEA